MSHVVGCRCVECLLVRLRLPSDRFRKFYTEGSGCWEWTGAMGGSGNYGVFYDGTRQVYAHRYAYELAKGPIPRGLQIDHLCRNTACVNPAHLEVVTQRENILRGTSLIADNARKTHCQNGHPLSGDNLVIRSSGYRQCRTCNLARRRWRHAHGMVS